MWLTASGILELSTAPKRNKEPSKSLIVRLSSDDLDTYYQWFVVRKFGQGAVLQRPMFGTHVSVVRKYELVSDVSLAPIIGKLVTFAYSVELQKTHQFWSLPVRSAELNQIRVNYGLLAVDNLHITIGRQYDWQ